MSSSTTERAGSRKARLFVILARGAPRALIFRRGPSRWVELILWDTRSDEFERGQWFHGRLYERRCDLSPDGRRVIYFAAKFERVAKGHYYTWTAISRPPFLTALALWPWTSAWDGGGLFETNRSLWVNQSEGLEEWRVKRPSGLTIRFEASGGECCPVFVPRLLRDGWTARSQHGWDTLMARPSPDGRFTLLMKWQGLEFSNPLTYAAREWDSGRVCHLPGIGWADFDQAGCLVYSREGRLYRGAYVGDGRLKETLLADFTDHEPREVAAPEWALKW